MKADSQSSAQGGNGVDPYPFVAEGGINLQAPESADPYAALDDLMKVVEALCPVWPERETFKEGPHWLL
ncbi:MAG: hypothetical protein ABUS47_03450 [Steroidobacter sp.]